MSHRTHTQKIIDLVDGVQAQTAETSVVHPNAFIVLRTALVRLRDEPEPDGHAVEPFLGLARKWREDVLRDGDAMTEAEVDIWLQCAKELSELAATDGRPPGKHYEDMYGEQAMTEYMVVDCTPDEDGICTKCCNAVEPPLVYSGDLAPGIARAKAMREAGE